MSTGQQIAVQRKRYRISRKSVADAGTPFIRNCWYVAASSAEIGRSLDARTLLGVPVLLYRKTDGEVVALNNRCPHRSYPLSKGQLDGDTVICGYHGLRYNADGRCALVPGRGKEASALGVQHYPVLEVPPFVWIWMGDPEVARTAPSPVPDWLGHPGWDTQTGYLHVQGSYVHMHENLLDLSHLTYLHANSFGTPEYAGTPIEIAIEDEHIQVWRSVACVLPRLYAEPLGWTGERAIRKSGSEFVSPALHVNTGLFANLDRPAASPQSPAVKVAQLLTPETRTTMHYHFALCRNFALGNPAARIEMLKGMTMAFAEDQAAMAEITRQQALSGEDDFYEFDIPTDRAGIEMRRRLKRLADLETP